MPRLLALFAVGAFLLGAQQSPPTTLPPTGPPAVTPDAPVEFVCPMDPEVRSSKPGKCPRCGMTLVAGIPDEREYPVTLTTHPSVVKPNEDTEVDFRIEDPSSGELIHDYQIVHEKLYHLFVVSQDLTSFQHIHPIIQPDGSFRLNVRFPKPGLYRVLSDFYPKGGTPQLIASAVMVPGPGFALAPAKLMADLSPQKSENIGVELTTEPAQPIAGQKTLMFFRIRPAEGIEPYIGAWGHMLAVSWDTIDLMHTHPFLVTDPEPGMKQIQFNLIFPREGIYRVWVQFQRKGVVNTVAFNIPVSVLK